MHKNIKIHGKIQKAVQEPQFMIQPATRRRTVSAPHFVSGIRVAAIQDENQKALQRVLFNLDLSPCTLCSLSARTRQISWELRGLYRLRREGAAHPDQQGLNLCFLCSVVNLWKDGGNTTFVNP